MDVSILIALIAPALWASINLIDSKLRNHHIGSDLVLSLACGFMGIISVFLIPFVDFHSITFSLFLLILISGVIYVSAMFPYFKAISKEDISVVITILVATQLFVPFFAKLFLSESLTNIQYLGFFLIFSGGFIISLKFKSFKNFKFSQAVILTIISGLLFDIYFLMEKYIYSKTNFWNGFIWIRITTFLFAFSFLISKKNRKNILGSFKSFKPLLLISLSELINYTALIFFGLAINLGSVTLVTSMLNFQSLFVLIYVIAFSKYFPTLYYEEMNPKTLFQKFLAIVLLLVGLFLII